MKALATRVIPVLATVVIATACAGFAAKGAAEDATAQFHQRLDAEQFDQIYEATDELFKSAATRAQFTEMLAAVHRKLGRIVSSTQTSFYSRDQAGTNAGSYISLTYETKFADGASTESFNWRVVGAGVRLVGYRIDSPTLITK
jgi:Protein of unknown function (DUF4019)